MEKSIPFILVHIKIAVFVNFPNFSPTLHVHATPVLYPYLIFSALRIDKPEKLEIFTNISKYWNRRKYLKSWWFLQKRPQQIEVNERVERATN